MKNNFFENKILIQTKTELRAVSLNEIVYISAVDSSASSVFLVTGSELASPKPIAFLNNQLKKYSFFAQCHKNYIVNLANMYSYKSIQKIVYLVFKINNKQIEIPVSPSYSEKIKKYLDVPTLSNIFPYNRIEKILKHERIKNYEKDLRFFSNEELLKEFGAHSSKLMLKPVYVKNVIWQLYNWIKLKKAYPVEGNIRTLWYSHIKSVFSRLNILDQGDDTIINTVLVELTYKYNLFKYSDLGLVDENRHNWKIGAKNPHIIVFAEKAGHLNTLEQINEQSGVSVIALGGQPSHLTTEYFTTELLNKIASSSFVLPEKNIDLFENPTFYLYSIVDWDPSGYFIKKSFLDQLKAKSLINIKITDMITPGNFKPEELDFIKYKLKPTPGEEGKNRNWVKLTGGVKGEPYGIEADAMPRVALKKLFFEKSAEHFKEVPPSVLAMIDDKRILKIIKNRSEAIV